MPLPNSTLPSNTPRRWPTIPISLGLRGFPGHRTFRVFLGFFVFLILFIYLWLCWGFVSVRGLSLVAASGGHSSSRCAGLSLSQPLLLRSTGSRRAGSIIVARGPSCSAACGIFPDQGSNPCSLHWQADSEPLRHQGSPRTFSFKTGKLWDFPGGPVADSMLPTQGAWVQSLVRELDPTCHN